MRTKRGQALIELACGLVTVALVVSMVCGFASFIARSLEVQNSLRSQIQKASGEKIHFGDYFEQLIGVEYLQIKENVEMPSTTIL